MPICWPLYFDMSKRKKKKREMERFNTTYNGLVATCVASVSMRAEKITYSQYVSLYAPVCVFTRMLLTQHNVKIYGLKEITFTLREANGKVNVQQHYVLFPSLSSFYGTLV